MFLMPIVFQFESKISALKNKTPFSDMVYLLFKNTVVFLTFIAAILRMFNLLQRF